MASHIDIARRCEKVGATEIYVSEPPVVLAKIQRLVAGGTWPLAVNIKGGTPDQTLIVMTLAGFEAMQRGTLEPEADHEDVSRANGNQSSD